MPERPKPRGRRPGGGDALTTADLVVLSLLAEHPMHGYDLLAEYTRQEVVDWASISKAQLYYALKKLDGLGYLKGTLVGTSRDRTVYKPTAAGVRALSAGLSDMSWATGRIAQPFLTWFGLSIHAPLDSRTDILRARLRFLDQEIAKEQRSLTYIATLRDERAIKGAHIVRLTIEQLQLERDWVSELLETRI
jgi:DNA-binding PadR family transcriptional regulator